MSAKEAARAMFEKLPDDCTFEDIEYHLYVLKSIERGLHSLETEKVYSRDEGWAQLRQWAKEKK